MTELDVLARVAHREWQREQATWKSDLGALALRVYYTLYPSTRTAPALTAGMGISMIVATRDRVQLKVDVRPTTAAVFTVQWTILCGGPVSTWMHAYTDLAQARVDFWEIFEKFMKVPN